MAAAVWAVVSGVQTRGQCARVGKGVTRATLAWLLHGICTRGRQPLLAEPLRAALLRQARSPDTTVRGTIDLERVARVSAAGLAGGIEWMALPLFLAWGIGQLERERTVATALCFYVPSSAVALVMGGAWLRARAHGRLAHAVVWFVLALAPAGVVLGVENHWGEVARAHPAVPSSFRAHRAVHWNVWSGLAGGWLVRRGLTREHADLLVVSELPPNRSLDVVMPRLSGAWSVARRWQLAVMARGLLEPGSLERFHGARVWPVAWTATTGERIDLLVVDVPSDPAQPRAPILRWVRRRIAALSPDLIVGDFNTPRRARGLETLPPGYAHAYDRVGAGWSATFPVPAPLWAIDQTIFGTRVEPIAYELRTPLGSDHRLQRFDFALRDPISTSPACSETGTDHSGPGQE